MKPKKIIGLAMLLPFAVLTVATMVINYGWGAPFAMLGAAAFVAVTVFGALLVFR